MTAHVCMHPDCDQDLNDPFQQLFQLAVESGFCRNHYQQIPFSIRLYLNPKITEPEDIVAKEAEALNFFQDQKLRLQKQHPLLQERNQQ